CDVFPLRPELRLLPLSREPTNGHSERFPSTQAPPWHLSPVQTGHMSPFLSPGQIDWNIPSPTSNCIVPQETRQRQKEHLEARKRDKPCSCRSWSFASRDAATQSRSCQEHLAGRFVTIGDVLDADWECDCPGCIRFDNRPQHARSQSDTAGTPSGSVLLTDDRAPHPQFQPATRQGAIEKWRWLGLVASTAELEVWTLLLDARRGLGGSLEG
ncbi:hypothetical protein FA13DRAFT_1732065, partial [Coprinellus micaceus]